MIQAETLELLEWSRLCQHLATFAATKLGATAARHLQIPAALSETLGLLAQTQEAYQIEQNLPSGLKFDGIQDIGEALERSQLQGILSGDELLAIATTLAGARQLRRTIDSQPDLPVLTELVSELRTYPELEQEIHRCIDDRGKVADRASPKLGGIREQLRQVRDRIYQMLQRILQRQSNAVQEPVITQRGDRFVIPVKAPQKDAIPGIVHDTSSSGLTLYVEPHSVVNLGNQLRQLTRQEQVEEEAVRRVLTEQVAAVKPDLERLLAIATILDLATARARYSLWLGANPPRFIDRSAGERITLRQLRHPLLVWQNQHEQGTPVVPIDLLIQPQIHVVAITGPNTGGKTVTLKTLGLAVLMAKVGLFVPAREPVELPWFDHILADIGDEQSLEQSLSTFSGHIRRISRILEAIGQGEGKGLGAGGWGLGEEELATETQGSEEIQEQSTEEQADNSSPQPLVPSPQPPSPSSLVLLDEVGAGTDPSEGSALAIALLRYLADHAQLTIATTHFGELKALKYQDDRFENASVEFDDVSLSPTYRLLWGIPGRSNALAIARRLGLKPEIIDQAQGQVGLQASEDVNQVIAGLEAQRRQQEQKAQETAQLLQQAERLHGEVARKAALLKERERDLQQQQEQAVQSAIAQAKAEIAQVIRQLQRGPATAQDAQQATESLNQIAQQQLPSRKPAKPKPGFRPRVGDRVRIPRLGQTAEVLTNPDEDGELSVRFGLMKMTVSLADVESLNGEKAELPAKPKPAPEPPPPPPADPAPTVRTSRNTVDIRGSRVADAEVVLERAIASAEAGALWIIHGHGTGKLRQGVHEFLKQHPQVSRYELAERTDGGSGVTIAYIQ
ncbi:endonuclease MutS2 [Leptolyngbya sp. FACHB-541]|uniref:endonuclease MutS2 n=1 Tax=Leptolyngbya sp. FACHB-541 TaxID=2692810 RepID=UPI0016876AAD|nr:endonuclease MutS2 [Leptolyngbya sp. FACHB-541]MBD2000936.1 endonuclease MutS2 [Leptolyngbya sp. FACHB-541]